MDFAVPADHRVKLKESEKKDKYLDLDRELNKKVTVIPIIIGALDTVTEGLIHRLKDLAIKGQVETIQSSSSSSSYRAGSTDIPDPQSPLLPIVHRPR